MVLTLSLYSLLSLWLYSDYPYTHHGLFCGPQSIPTNITFCLVVLRVSLYASQSLWWYSEYPYNHQSESSCWSSVYPYPHHILFDGTQTKPIRIIVSLVVLGISPYSPQSTWWLRQSLYSSQSPSRYPDYPFSHHSLPGGTQTINIFITVSLVVLRLSLYSSVSLVILILFLYSSQPPWWYLGYPYTHRSLFGGPQYIPNHITFCFVVLRVSLYRVSSQSTYWLRQSLYSSQSTWWLRQSLYSSQSSSWYPDYPFTHPVCLVVLGLSLYSSQSPWWYSEYPFTHRNLLG